MFSSAHKTSLLPHFYSFFVFSRCGKFISSIFLCCVILVSFMIPSFAASDTVYNIRDFQCHMFTAGNGGTDYSNTVAYDTYTLKGVVYTRAYNTNSNFYASGLGKNEWFINITNLNLNDEYNINFDYCIFKSISYSIDVNLLDGSNAIVGSVYSATYNDSTNSLPHNCNVNFSLKNLNVTSNSGIKLLITVTVPSAFGSDFRFGFSDITLTNLDDTSGLLDSILNWLSRIYHSIAGGTDREGVNHTGIVAGFIEGMNNLKSALQQKLEHIKDNINDKLETVKTNIVNAISGIQQWFIDLKDNIINGLKSLFIPRESYITDKKTELDTFFTNHFGALYQAPGVMIDTIQMFVTITPEQPQITMPSIEFDFQGVHHVLNQPIVYSFSWVNDSNHPLYYFYRIYKGFVIVVLFFLFGNYLINKYNDIFGGRDEG